MQFDTNSRCSCNLWTGCDNDRACSKDRAAAHVCSAQLSGLCFAFFEDSIIFESPTGNGSVDLCPVSLCRDESLRSPGQKTSQRAGRSGSLRGVSIFFFLAGIKKLLDESLDKYLMFPHHFFFPFLKVSCPRLPPPSVPPSVLHNIVLSACLPSLISGEVEVRMQQSEANRFSFGSGQDFPGQGYTHCARARPARPAPLAAPAFHCQNIFTTDVTLFVIYCLVATAAQQL